MSGRNSHTLPQPVASLKNTEDHSAKRISLLALAAEVTCRFGCAGATGLDDWVSDVLGFSGFIIFSFSFFFYNRFIFSSLLLKYS